MIEEILDLPDGVIGFRLYGRVSGADVRTQLPPLQKALDEGRQLRYLCQIGPGFERFSVDAAWEDIKAQLRSVFRRYRSWKRSALVTDIGWIRHGVRLIGWIGPGEVKVFPLNDLSRAKTWVAG